jgi:uncharacterized protein YbaR (Trm112 family)
MLRGENKAFPPLTIPGFVSLTSEKSIYMDKKLLDILACPICKGKLVYQKAQQELVCKFDRLAFPIQDSIPIMLEDSARPISSEENETIK